MTGSKREEITDSKSFSPEGKTVSKIGGMTGTIMDGKRNASNFGVMMVH